MATILAAARYGKDLVRVCRVVRRDDGSGVQDVVEYNVSALVEGDIATSYTQSDNSVIVATDSIKNIIYYLAKTSPHVLAPELFALHIGAFLLEKYAHLAHAHVALEQLRWSRIDGHAHSFLRDGAEKRVATVDVARGADGALAAEVAAGLVDLLVLKTSGSSFAGFVRDEFTTLPEVDDRIFSTAVELEYVFPRVEGVAAARVGELEARCGFARAAAEARRITLGVFAEDASASVQATLYKMGQQLLAAHEGIERVSYVLPNKHYIPVDMRYLDIDNLTPSAAEVFVPVAAPSGRITATVARAEASV